jgi:hypothetical protein
MTSDKPELKSTAFSNYLSQEDFHKMIAICAYYKAKKRGFVSGYELKDWTEAEREINEQNFYKFQT